ncbi:MAG: hypothetical protein HOE53_00120 [Candidatus Magasanikbacteria bacterium]|nr:hypothetical protein [Candidatus Magasanikbacteria bacterium]
MHLLGIHLYQLERLTSQEDVVRIMQMIHVIPQEATILTFSSLDAPWLVGYTKNQVIAPGVFDTDPWPDFFWRSVVQGDSQELLHTFFSAIELDIYVYSHPDDAGFVYNLLSTHSGTTQLTPRLWKINR